MLHYLKKINKPVNQTAENIHHAVDKSSTRVLVEFILEQISVKKTFLRVKSLLIKALF
jgi:hypothetical protein